MNLGVHATRRFSKIYRKSNTIFSRVCYIINLVCTYSSKGAQNILTILNMKNGSQQIPNITTTDVIILMDFFFLAIKFSSLPSSLLPGIKDTKYKVHPWRLSLVSSNIENICLTLCIGMVMVGKLLIQKSR